MFNRDSGEAIKMWTAVFPGRFYDKLNKFLFSSAPYENGCFLLTNSYKTKDRSVLLVTDMVEPTSGSWNKMGTSALEPSSSYTNQCVMAADAMDTGLVFVHTHPNILHPSTFSRTDQIANRRMFANMSQILPGRPIGSMVFSRKGICGTIFDGNSTQDVSKIKIVGNSLIEFPGIGYGTGRPNVIGDEFDRQVRALGEQNQKKLQDIKITIVGVGGTGSPVAIQLAKMGVRYLRLIDMDTVDITNLPRVYGSSDADIGKPKVDVVKRHIGTFAKSEVSAVHADVADKDVLGLLVESDVILACSDNLTSRSVLNEISHRFYIPLIDVGCRISLDKDDSISQAIAKVQVVTPDSACLWCTNTLDGKAILQESFSEEEKRRLAKEGYYDGIEKQPSVISLTTMAASMAVNKILSLIGTFGTEYNPRTQIELKGGFMVDDRPKIKENCICQKDRGRGKRDRCA